MKHAITLATAIFAVSAAYAGTFQTWNGEDGISQVNTGLDNGSETSGYWFSYADDGDGGESKVNWPADTRTWFYRSTTMFPSISTPSTI